MIELIADLVQFKRSVLKTDDCIKFALARFDFKGREVHRFR